MAAAQHQAYQAQEEERLAAAATSQQAQQAQDAARAEAAIPRIRIIGNVESVTDSGLLIKYYLSGVWMDTGGNITLARSSINRPKLIDKFGEYFITGHPKQGELVDGDGLDLDAIPDGRYSDGGETFAKFKVIKAYKDPFK